MGTIEAKANKEKQVKVAALEEKLRDLEGGIVFTDFSGLTVSEINDLRGKFHQASEVEYVVAKNTLIRIALKNLGHDIADDGVLRGNTGMAIGISDPVAPAKLIADFVKEHKDNKKEKPAFKGALVDGEFYDVEKVKALAALPPVEQIYASIVGSVSSPLSNFVGLLNEIPRSFVAVLDAIIEKKKAEEAA